MVLLDDSGSMDFQVVADTEDLNGGIILDNGGGANSGVRERSYFYLWDLDNAFSPTSTYGRILPTEEALDADPTRFGASYLVRDYGVWRARNHLFNRTYYNPEIRYEPWEGHDEDGNAFTGRGLAKRYPS